MTSIALPRPHAAARALSAARREIVLFVLAIAALALHVIDANFLQPSPGTSPGDHAVSGLIPLAVLSLAGWAYPRLRAGGRAATALAFGALGVVASADSVYYAREVGASGEDFTGLLVIPAALLLLVLGAVTLWRSRRLDGSRPRRYLRRALRGVAALVVVVGVIYPVSWAYVSTHFARAVVPANHLGVAYEDVTFTTGDGLELEGWYVPSKNGAAVIASGRSGPQKQARVLARHGYGVLLFDRRGEGASDGDPHGYGWGGDADVKAAIDYLQRRPDVEDGRIGGIGLSVGGEMMLEAAAETSELKAVVSEGAGARMLTEELDREKSGVDRAILAPLAAVKNASLAVFSNQMPPANLRDLVGRIAPRPLLLIAAPNSPNGEWLNRDYAAAAGDSAELWEIPESAHVGGLEARPEEYERRIVEFFDRSL